MGSESTISALIIGFGLAALMAVWPVEASFGSLGRPGLRDLAAKEPRLRPILDALSKLPMGPVAGLSAVRVLALTALAVAAGFLLLNQEGAGWASLALAGAGWVLFVAAAYALSTAIARAFGESIVARSSVAVLWLSRPFFPLAWLLQKVIGALASAWGQARAAESEDALAEVPLSLTTDGEPLDETERRMIRGVIRLDDTPAREIMIPRVDMVAVEMGTPIAELAGTMLAEGHSRIPIFEGSLDHIVGVAYARDALHQFSQGESTTNVGPGVVRPVLFIPESKNLEDLLEEFKSSRVHMAIVVDEYGGVSGLVTIEDLLEEIVGEIMDEFDQEGPEIRPLSETEFLLDAGMGIDELHELVGVSVKGNGFDTLGGLVFERLGKIPSPGDTVDEAGVKIRVVSTEGRRPKTLRVTKMFPTDEG